MLSHFEADVVKYTHIVLEIDEDVDNVDLNIKSFYLAKNVHTHFKICPQTRFAGFHLFSFPEN